MYMSDCSAKEVGNHWRMETSNVQHCRCAEAGESKRNALIVRKQIAYQLDSFPFVQTELK
jgi:hypothetical protein